MDANRRSKKGSLKITQLGAHPARIARLLVWSGPVFVALSAAGLVMAHLFPVPSPTKTGSEIAAVFAEHKIAARFGLCLLLFSFTLFGTWSGVIVTLMRRMEKGFPVLTYTSIVLVATSLVIFIVSVIFWGVAAFRPDEIAPELTRSFHDAGWLIFVWPWPPFSVWWLLLGLAILNDHNSPPLFPSWVGWTCFEVAILIMPVWTVLFFKTGPVAWNGAISFYAPVAFYLAWTINFTVFMLKAVRRVASEDDALPIFGPSLKHAQL